MSFPPASPSALRLAFAYKESSRWENVQITSDVCNELCHSGCFSDNMKKSTRGDRRHLSVTVLPGLHLSSQCLNVAKVNKKHLPNADVSTLKDEYLQRRDCSHADVRFKGTRQFCNLTEGQLANKVSTTGRL